MSAFLRTLLFVCSTFLTTHAWAHGDLRGGQGTIGFLAAMAIFVFPVLALISAACLLMDRKKGAKARRFWISFFKTYGALVLLVSINMFFVDYVEKMFPAAVSWFAPLVPLSLVAGFSAPWWWRKQADKA